MSDYCYLCGDERTRVYACQDITQQTLMPVKPPDLVKAEQEQREMKRRIARERAVQSIAQRKAQIEAQLRVRQTRQNKE